MKNEFKAGVWVYVTDDTGQDSAIPEEHRLTQGESRLIEDISPHGWLRVYGSPAYWIPQRFAVEKPRKTPKLDALMAPAPTFEVGQQVSGGDYTLLPVGTAVEAPEIGITFTKTAPDAWGKPGSTKTYTDSEMSPTVRTVVNLPGGKKTAPKKGDWLQVWVQVEDPDTDGDVRGAMRTMAHGGGERRTLYVQPEAAVFPPAGSTPPWVKETPEPGGRYAIVRSGPIQHSRHNAAGGWLGTDGAWRTWEEVCKMATRANDPKTMVSDEEGTRA